MEVCCWWWWFGFLYQTCVSCPVSHSGNTILLENILLHHLSSRSVVQIGCHNILVVISLDSSCKAPSDSGIKW